MKLYKKLNPFWWLLHLINHLLNRNVGKIVGWNESGYTYIAFRCECGHISKSTIQRIRFHGDDETNYNEEL